MRGAGIVAVLLLARLALPLVLRHPAWEFHRDELLYFAMGDHLSLWNMQFPPLVPAIAALGKAAFGESVLAARVPAAVGGVLLLLPMLLAVRSLGGGAFALLLTTLASVAAPVFLRSSVLLQPVVFDQAWAAWALLGVMLACRRDEPRWWMLTGLAFGLGLLTRFSAPVHGLVLLLAALLAPATRSQLRTPWPWMAGALALGLGAPSLVGQVVNGWPFLEQLRSLRVGQLARVTPGEYFGDQVLMLGAAVVPALAGVAWALRPRTGDAGIRAALQVVLGFAALLLALYALARGKAYYAAPAWPMLVAGGAAWLEGATGRLAQRTMVAASRALLTALVLGGAVGLLPMGVPCLAPERMARYAAALGAGTSTNYGTELTLPQDYADMLGWRDQVDAMAAAWRTLPDTVRATAAVSASNYGQLGAIAFYGPLRGLPYPISTESDFWAWGTRGYSGDVVLVAVTAGDEAGYAALWASVTEVGAVRNPWRVEEERDVRIFLLRGLQVPLKQLWRERGPGWT